jgi:hypothetical protein
MSDPVYIKRLAIQFETTDGQFLHLYCEDPGLVLTLKREANIEPSPFTLGRVAYADPRTTVTVENLRNYRITMGKPFADPKEIENSRELEQ